MRRHGATRFSLREKITANEHRLPALRAGARDAAGTELEQFARPRSLTHSPGRAAHDARFSPVLTSARFSSTAVVVSPADADRLWTDGR